MKVKWGALVVDGRNKIGGQVASKNRAGAYFRNKVTPVNPQSENQVTVRARLAANAQGWRGLTDAQRAAWNAAVSDYKRTDIFGDIRNPSGFNLYVKINNNLDNIGVAGLNLPESPINVSVFDTGALTADESTPSLSLAVTPTTQPTGETIIVFATPAISAGKTFVKNLFRQIATFTAATAGAYDLTAAWTAKFGTLGPAGSKVFVKVIHVSEITGQASQVQEFSTIIVA